VNELLAMLTEIDLIRALPAPYAAIVSLALQVLKDRKDGDERLRGGEK